MLAPAPVTATAARVVAALAVLGSDVKHSTVTNEKPSQNTQPMITITPTTMITTPTPTPLQIFG